MSESDQERERPLLELVVVFSVVAALVFGALFWGFEVSLGHAAGGTVLVALALFALVLLSM